MRIRAGDWNRQKEKRIAIVRRWSSVAESILIFQPKRCKVSCRTSFHEETNSTGHSKPILDNENEDFRLAHQNFDKNVSGEWTEINTKSFRFHIVKRFSHRVKVVRLIYRIANKTWNRFSYSRHLNTDFQELKCEWTGKFSMLKCLAEISLW